MCTISHSKHTKLKNTKIYSKGILVNHTKISTNENFPLYGMRRKTFARKQVQERLVCFDDCNSLSLLASCWVVYTHDMGQGKK